MIPIAFHERSRTVAEEYCRFGCSTQRFAIQSDSCVELTLLERRVCLQFQLLGSWC